MQYTKYETNMWRFNSKGPKIWKKRIATILLSF